MRGPFDGDAVIQVGPRRMVFLGLALVCDERHEAPGFCEAWKRKFAHDALSRLADLPCGKEARDSIGQIAGLVGSKDYVIRCWIPAWLCGHAGGQMRGRYWPSAR